jgi:hypothetical protein
MDFMNLYFRKKISPFVFDTNEVVEELDQESLW